MRVPRMRIRERQRERTPFPETFHAQSVSQANVSNAQHRAQSRIRRGHTNEGGSVANCRHISRSVTLSTRYAPRTLIVPCSCNHLRARADAHLNEEVEAHAPLVARALRRRRNQAKLRRRCDARAWCHRAPGRTQVLVPPGPWVGDGVSLGGMHEGAEISFLGTFLAGAGG